MEAMEQVRRPTYSDVLRGDIKPSLFGTLRKLQSYSVSRSSDFAVNDNRRRVVKTAIKPLLDRHEIADADLISKLSDIMSRNLRGCEDRTVTLFEDELSKGHAYEDIEKTNTFLEDDLMATFRQRLAKLKDKREDEVCESQPVPFWNKRPRRKTLCSFCKLKKSLNPLTEDLVEMDQQSASLRSAFTESSIPHMVQWSLLFKTFRRIEATVKDLENASAECTCDRPEREDLDTKSCENETDIGRMSDLLSDMS